MVEPTLNQLSAGFTAARTLADSSEIYSRMISDDMIRKWVAMILQAALNAEPPVKAKGKK